MAKIRQVEPKANKPDWDSLHYAGLIDQMHWQILLDALAELRPPVEEAMPILRKWLGDEQTALNLRIAAAMAVWRFSGDTNQTLPLLLRALTESKNYPLLQAMRGLKAIGPPAKAAIPELKKGLNRWQEDPASGRKSRPPMDFYGFGDFLDVDVVAAQAFWAIERDADVILPLLLARLGAPQTRYAVLDTLAERDRPPPAPAKRWWLTISRATATSTGAG